MAYNIDVSNEWRYIGNTEAVTLFRRLTDNTFDAGTPVANAFSPGSIKTLDAGGKLLSRIANSWHLWASQTAGPPPATTNPDPKIGDVLQDSSGVRWVIWRVDVQAWGYRFLIDTKKER